MVIRISAIMVPYVVCDPRHESDPSIALADIEALDSSAITMSGCPVPYKRSPKGCTVLVAKRWKDGRGADKVVEDQRLSYKTLTEQVIFGS